MWAHARLQLRRRLRFAEQVLGRRGREQAAGCAGWGLKGGNALAAFQRANGGGSIDACPPSWY